MLSFFQLARKLDGLALVALAERLTVAVMYQHLTVDDILGYLLRKARELIVRGPAVD